MLVRARLPPWQLRGLAGWSDPIKLEHLELEFPAPDFPGWEERSR